MRNYFCRTMLNSSTIRNAQVAPETQSPWRTRFMMKKIALALLIALTLCPVASFAQVAIRIGPPHRVYEDRGRPPERGYVWTGGYHRYDGRSEEHTSELQ